MFWTPSSIEHEHLQPQPGIISKTERILVNGLNKAKHYTKSGAQIIINNAPKIKQAALKELTHIRGLIS
jgi:hypothetical protein